MQVLLNSIIFIFAYFFAQIFLYRFLKINVNKPSIIIIIIGISILIAVYFYSTETIINLISINLLNICFYIMMFPVTNKGPSLIIIDLIFNKKITKKKKLKKYFLKGHAGTAIDRRLKFNVSSNFIKYKKGRFFLNDFSKKIIDLSNLIKKLYRLKPDA